MGYYEPLVQWSLQSKKVPKGHCAPMAERLRHFFEILGANRNKLLARAFPFFCATCSFNHADKLVAMRADDFVFQRVYH
jgi:hypothetical protein